MSTIPKIIAQLLPSSTSLTDLYTVPTGKTATLSSVTVCNNSGSQLTFRISVAIAGVADNNKQYLYYDLPIDANDTFIATIGLTLAATDKIRVKTNSANGLSFNCFGIEQG